ncbi:zinc metalloprotease HtpX [Carboxydothermus ferrireducens]|uniref:Protease HtpX homolog n=1 Tax=Carboxydothermus ferrireducens DSM 11255 TaxID=1119529 RepID=A0ABX2RCE0_9THEO|nr:zinc metalloprotease HtpX [Carboxydothermus ferrireducens]NYE57473.1 heat shock protein HtpX [Carboxydothermus ferrireducens DSM 11255]
MTNTIKTWLLMGVLTVLLVLLGRVIGGTTGAFTFFLIALAMNFISYYFSDTLVIKMTGSYPVSEAEAPELYSIVRNLSLKAGIPMPKIYITPSPQPNAFATGRNPEHAAVAVTEGLLNLLNRQEIEGVLAHEIAHIKNRDILIGTIAAAMAGAISMLADVFRWGLFFGGGRDDDNNPGGLIADLILLILAPIAALLVQLAISRSREYLADETGAKLAGSPVGLAEALKKLHAYSLRIPMEVSPAASHMFIVNPLNGRALMALFSTHPPIEDRIERLYAMRW